MIKRYLFIIVGIILSFQIVLSQTNFPPDLTEECTIGVASGKATTDGRPLLWKTRDNSSSPNNEVIFNTSFPIKFISVVSAGGTYSWMGVNEKGFAIINSLSSDLDAAGSGFSNGEIMREALGTCATIDEFEQMLENTNASGRKTAANFGVIDSTGGAAIFETAGHEFWKYDAHDSTTAPNGYILRTNFAFNGAAKNGLHDNIYSVERYRRQRTLINSYYAGDTLNYRSIARYQMRDFSDFDSDPVPVPFPDHWLSYRPFGYIFANVSICRTTSVSAAVIQGILPDEPAKLSTMWTLLGQPASSIFVPYWPVGETPPEADGSSYAPLCNVALLIRAQLFDYQENSNYIDSYKLRDENGNGLWAHTFPAEDSIITAAENWLEIWRSNGLNKNEMLSTERALAQYALQILNNAYYGMITNIQDQFVNQMTNDFMLNQNYPNPFNSSTTIEFTVPTSSQVSLKIFNVLGQEIETLIHAKYEPGHYLLNYRADELSTGLYFYHLEATYQQGNQSQKFSDTKSFQLLK